MLIIPRKLSLFSFLTLLFSICPISIFTPTIYYFRRSCPFLHSVFIFPPTWTHIKSRAFMRSVIMNTYSISTIINILLILPAPRSEDYFWISSLMKFHHHSKFHREYSLKLPTELLIDHQSGRQTNLKCLLCEVGFPQPADINILRSLLQWYTRNLPWCSENWIQRMLITFIFRFV